MKALDAQPDAVAGTDATTIGSPRLGIALVARVVDAACRALTRDSGDSAAEGTKLGLGLARANTGHGNAGVRGLARIAIRAVVTAADRIVLARAHLRLDSAAPERGRTRALPRAAGFAVLAGAACPLGRPCATPPRFHPFFAADDVIQICAAARRDQQTGTH